MWWVHTTAEEARGWKGLTPVDDDAGEHTEKKQAVEWSVSQSSYYARAALVAV